MSIYRIHFRTVFQVVRVVLLRIYLISAEYDAEYFECEKGEADGSLRRHARGVLIYKLNRWGSRTSQTYRRSHPRRSRTSRSR